MSVELYPDRIQYGQVSVPIDPSWSLALSNLHQGVDYSVLFIPTSGLKQVDEFIKLVGPCVVFPSKDPVGNVCGYFLRSVEGKKFKYVSSYFPFYSRDQIEKSSVLYLVEGVKDQVSLRAAGLINVYSCLTNSISAFQVDWLRLLHSYDVFKRVVIVYDNDVRPDGRNPGLVGANLSMKKLSAIGITSLAFPTPVLGKDPGDLIGDKCFVDWLVHLNSGMEVLV